MSRRRVWEEVYARFDPERPAEQREDRVDRPGSPTAKIIEALDRPFGQPRVLFTGTVGTGKTTELLRVKDSAALQRISPWEVCFLAGLGLIAEVRRQGAPELPEEHLHSTEGSRACSVPSSCRAFC
jgi:hypothetical protein